MLLFLLPELVYATWRWWVGQAARRTAAAVGSFIFASGQLTFRYVSVKKLQS